MEKPYIPKWNELFGPTLDAIRSLDGSGTISEIVEKVIEQQGFTEDQQAVVHGEGPQTEIEYRLAWARTNLKQLGALDNKRGSGVWTLTDYGKAVTEEELVAADKALRQKWAEERKAKTKPPDPDSDDVDVVSRDWQQVLIDRLLRLSPAAFERLAKRLLREAGFDSVETLGGPKDQGIDGTGLYRVSLMSFPTYFQCKRYQGSVRASQVRDFRGAMAGRGDQGLLITTGSFTQDARDEARRPGAPRIELIDGDTLCDLLKRYRLGVSVEERTEEDVTIEPAFFEAFET